MNGSDEFETYSPNVLHLWVGLGGETTQARHTLSSTHEGRDKCMRYDIKAFRDEETGERVYNSSALPAQIIQPVQPIVLEQQFRASPVSTICPYCHAKIVTVIRFEAGDLTCAACCILFVVGCVPCAFIPCYLDCCQDAIHTCPNCRRIIAIWSRM